MTSKVHHQGPERTSKIRAHAVKLAVWSAMILIPAWIASPAAHAQTFQVIHHFAYDAPEGSDTTWLTHDAAGNLIGTTNWGGPARYGSVFRLDPATRVLTVLHNFSGHPDGSQPSGNVVFDSAGNLYGTTFSGGAMGFGTVYKLDTSGVETILHSFNGTTDGEFPTGVIRDPAGNLYGTALFGPNGDGVVYRINSSGAFRTLYQFSGPDGSYPGALTRDSAGNLVGTTTSGGANGYGTLFQLAPDGTLTTLHSFNGTDGIDPEGAPLLDSAGNLYGTTRGGGDFSKGTVFKLDSSGVLTVLHSFNVSDGADPRTGVVMDTAANLYGTTFYGGATNYGVVFKLDPSGNETVVHTFVGTSDGKYPDAPLVLTPAGTIFGSTSAGSSNDGGTLFKMTF